jgi:hypothetical protein
MKVNFIFRINRRLSISLLCYVGISLLKPQILFDRQRAVIKAKRRCLSSYLVDNRIRRWSTSA